MNHTAINARTFQATRFNSQAAVLARLLSSIIAAAVVLGGAIQTHAQTTLTWTNTTGTGIFNDPSNWDPAQLPIDGDTTKFTNDTTYTINFTGNSAALYESSFSNHAGVVTIDPHGNTWFVTNVFRVGYYDSTTTVYLADGTLNVAIEAPSGTNAQLRIGDAVTNIVSSLATMIITNGTVKADAGVVGASSTAKGKLVITGNGVWTTAGNGSTLTCGSGSVGSQLLVTNGGQLTVDGVLTVGSSVNSSNNFLLVSGANSAVNITSAGLRVAGNGSLVIISNGAQCVMLTGGATLGANSSYSTTLVVGAGSSFTTPTGQGIQVGVNTSGGTNNNLSVYDGAFLSCGGSLQWGNNTFHNYDGINMGGAGRMSTGFAAVCRSNATITNHFGNYLTVSNAYFSTYYLNPQGPGEVVSILGNATFVLTNSTSIGPGASNSVSYGGSSGSPGLMQLVVNSGTLVDLQTPDNGGGLNIGGVGYTTVTITNGGKLLTSEGTLGAGCAFNTGIVSGAGSVWSNYSGSAGFTNYIVVGTGVGGTNNFLGVYDGASLYNNGTLDIGSSISGNLNRVTFGGPGLPVVVNNIGSLNIGATATNLGNVLLITNATVNSAILNVGNTGSTNDLLQINGGTVSIGFVRVRPTNTVVFTAGTLSVGGLTFDTLANSGGAFLVGDGIDAANYDMAAGGTGVHNFNNGGLVVTNNASLRGSGTVEGNVTVDGTFVPGFAGVVGSVFFSNDLLFASSAALNYDLGTSSDSVTVNGNLGLGGTLNIANSGGFGVGSYTIFSYVGSLTNNGTLTVGTNPNGSLTYAINTNTVGSVVLQVTSGGGGDLYTTWATHYFPGGGPNALGTSDPDHDGVNNTNEFLAGFNPTSAAAYPHVISIARSGADMNVTYLGANGDGSSYTGGPTTRTNVLEVSTGVPGSGVYSNNFVSTGKTNILSGGTGTGLVTNMIDTGGATGATRYYRIRVIAP